ncbi:MAG: RdgB/HAM1 family non-canonical purine NTP pyrophosphatase [Pseudomonadota bacterium]
MSGAALPARIVLATGNPGKLREFSRLLEPLSVTLVAQSELAVPEADETGLTFIENALIKARNAAEVTGLPALADDSGLEVDALDGAPGIYSARFAGAGASDAANVDLLLERLAGVEGAARSARFQCVCVYLRHAADPSPVVCQGTWEGAIADTPSGTNGFGYDPVFLPAGLAATSASLAPADKNRVSHRGQALAALLNALGQP